MAGALWFGINPETVDIDLNLGGENLNTDILGAISLVCLAALSIWNSIDIYKIKKNNRM